MTVRLLSRCFVARTLLASCSHGCVVVLHSTPLHVELRHVFTIRLRVCASLCICVVVRVPVASGAAAFDRL